MFVPLAGPGGWSGIIEPQSVDLGEADQQRSPRK